MRIQSIKIKNHFFEWEFEKILFPSNLTLLVGGSGVGKTQILRAIYDLKQIVGGESINGLEWKIEFSTITDRQFIWEGAFEVLEDERNGEEPMIRFENLVEKSKKENIVKRDVKGIYFNGQRTPKLSSSQSVLFILREDLALQEVYDAFNKINFNDYQSSENAIFSWFTKEENEKYQTLEAIKKGLLSIRYKLVLCSDLPIFETIKGQFIDIFSHVKDIKIDTKPTFLYYTTSLDAENVNITISIKEKDVSKWIPESRMSAGMLKTFLHIAELYLATEGTVVLMDEFENSLGVNCINILTEDLIHENQNIQFILTSHHPYIINNIPYEHWKIVSRKGGNISIRNAAEYKLGKSKQDAFLQLTKLLEKQFA